MASLFSVTVSSKGQITLPVELRRQLGLGKGKKINIELQDDNTALLCVPKSLDELHEYLAPRIAKVKPLEDVHSFYAAHQKRA
jgi:AbrB family looped-hinge helix DNA binding protein